MKSTIYPFLPEPKKYPEGSLLIKENLSNDSFSMIEYDKEHILKVLNNEDITQDFSDFPLLKKGQLDLFLKLVTRNIVEIELK